jgi:hypothetical protein
MQSARILVLTFITLIMFTTLLASAAEEYDSVVEPPSVPVSEIGRYQLFDGQFAVSTLKGPEVVAERHLFKIDTVTGTAWIGKQTQYVDKKSGRVVQQRYWELFEQYIEGPPATAPVK